MTCPRPTPTSRLCANRPSPPLSSGPSIPWWPPRPCWPDSRRRCVLSSANGYPVWTSSACWTPRDCDSHLTSDVEAARKLFDAVLSVFGPEQQTVDAAAAEAVVRALPETVRDALADPSATLLISGDPYWSTFPWEALHIGTGPDRQWLGLVQPLPRKVLTAPAFDALLPDAASAGLRAGRRDRLSVGRRCRPVRWSRPTRKPRRSPRSSPGGATRSSRTARR